MGYESWWVVAGPFISLAALLALSRVAVPAGRRAAFLMEVLPVWWALALIALSLRVLGAWGL
ncbi:MAG TPA: hypothetical protein VIY48_13235 [Candidatus Paceibacterota bacterium]